MEIIIAAVIAGVLAIISAFIAGALAPIFLDWWHRRRLETTGAAPKVTNQAAYELAYRGKLHNLAGRRRKCDRQIKTGNDWLREAAYQHKPSSRVGWNDAIDDIMTAVIASTAIGQDIRCDEQFLEIQISSKLCARFGNRPVAQVSQIRCDAMQSAALYQEIIQLQMRRLEMIHRTVRSRIGTIPFGIGAFLLAMIPSARTLLNGLSSDLILLISIIYVVVSIGLLIGGIVLLFTRTGGRNSLAVPFRSSDRSCERWRKP